MSSWFSSAYNMPLSSPPWPQAASSHSKCDIKHDTNQAESLSKVCLQSNVDNLIKL